MIFAADDPVQLEEISSALGGVDERRRDEADDEHADRRGDERGREPRSRLDVAFDGRRLEVHEPDDTQVVVSGKDTIHHARDREPLQVGVHRGAEDVDLGDEPDRWRHADQGNHREAQDAGQERGASGHASEVIYLVRADPV